MASVEDFLLEQVRAQEISDLTAVMAREALQRIRRRLPGMAEPAAAVGPNREIGLTWDKGRQHLEVEILDEFISVFYRDRCTGETFQTNPAPGRLVDVLDAVWV